MRSQSLFGEIALRLASHPENIATHSLLYILRAHSSAWPCLRAFLAPTDIEMPKNLAFSAQAFSDQDGAIPDMVGADSEGDQVLIVEAKFWAGLTCNQPVAYLRRLPEAKPALLLVIAPGQRFDALWGALSTRCTEGSLAIGAPRDIAPEFRCCRVSPTHCLALASWRAILGVLSQDAQTRGDDMLLGDLEQLHGLCARMDSDAFLPLNEHDLSRQTGRRMQQFADLVDDVVAELARNHGASTKGLTTGGSQSTYGRYFAYADLGFFFCYSPQLWARYGESPMWLQVTDAASGKWVDSPQIRERVARLCGATPRRVAEIDGRLSVAMYLPLGVERIEVIGRIIDQIKWVANGCSSASGAA